MKESLELAVERCGDSKAGVVAAALELMRKEIREATASMTSVPKPLKFLNPHFAKLKDVHKVMKGILLPLQTHTSTVAIHPCTACTQPTTNKGNHLVYVCVCVTGLGGW